MDTRLSKKKIGITKKSCHFFPRRSWTMSPPPEDLSSRSEPSPELKNSTAAKDVAPASRSPFSVAPQQHAMSVAVLRPSGPGRKRRRTRRTRKRRRSGRSQRTKSHQFAPVLRDATRVRTDVARTSPEAQVVHHGVPAESRIRQATKGKSANTVGKCCQATTVAADSMNF